MALTYSFYDAVKDKNIRRLRIMMSDSLVIRHLESLQKWMRLRLP